MQPEALPPHVSFPDTKASDCPSCGGGSCRTFYMVRDIPIHSCVLLGDAAQARDFPVGDLRLALCPSCGFVFNEWFDPARIDYSEDYEETQGYSGTFQAFLTQTIAGIAKQHSLSEQTVLEIGCGRGDFLEQLCQTTGARGIGIDPSQTAGRVDLNAGAGLVFHRETYGDKHHSIPAQGILCRHTLEHLPSVARLVELVRTHLSGQPEGWAFFELPDTQRILQEGAFWDIYYEHCSYFTDVSLGRLFASSGFQVHELERVYGDQYLHLHARPGISSNHEWDLTPVQAGVHAFQEQCKRSLAQWHAWLQESAPGSVALWGSGSKATAFLTTLGSSDRIQCVVDINPKKHGRFIAKSGHEIVGPADLVGRGIERVLIMNPIYRNEIGEDLASMGLQPEIRALGM